MSNYYQLLGISEDANEAAIRAAYRKAMLRIHPDLHPDDAAAQESAQQINSAFQMLVDPASRKTYDESLLRQRELEAAKLKAKAEQAAGPPKKESTLRASPARHTVGRSVAKSRDARKNRGAVQRPVRKASTFQKRLASFFVDKVAPLTVGMLCSGIIVLILYCVIKGKHPLDVFNETKTALTAKELVVDLGGNDADVTPSETSEATDEEHRDDALSMSEDAVEPNASEETNTAMSTDESSDQPIAGEKNSESSVVEPSSFPIGLGTEPVPAVGQEDEFNLSNDSQYLTGSITNHTVHPLPSDQESTEALKTVTSLFKERYATAKSRNQKRELANEILRVGLDTRDDVPGMFVLLRIARDMAIEVGDIRLAEQVIENISQRFEVDVQQAKLSAFESIEGKLVEREAKEYLFFASLKLVDEFEMTDAHEQATVACGIANSCANSLRNAKLTERAKMREEALDKTNRVFLDVEKYIARQALDERDAEANDQVGRYLCFWKGQWDRGLKMLTASSDPVLRNAAHADLQTVGSEGALETGEKWWAVADRLTGHESDQARARAVKFYLIAQETLDGLNRMKIEQRISTVDIKAIEYMTQRMFATSAGNSGVDKTASGFVNSIGMRLIRIPPGQFEMGSLPEVDDTATSGRGPALVPAFDEQPRHTVTLSQSFYMGVFEVTFAQFASFVRETGYQAEAARDGRGGEGWDLATKTLVQRPGCQWTSPGFLQTESHPVVVVSWNDADLFCQWLSRKENKTYRLPTEAEWEYACRAGTRTKFQHGDIAHDLERIANVLDSGAARTLAGQRISTLGDDAFTFTAPVGSFLPNRFGLYDMHGNVWEWCQDWYEPGYYAGSPSSDPTGPSIGSQRVFRGGAFLEAAAACRSAERNSRIPSYRSSTVGFRVVMEAAR